jgi:mannan endo-1,4-beta-mannosidase
MIRSLCFSTLFILLLSSLNTAEAQVNEGADEKTRVLYNNLKIIQNSNQFLFGQEFFNSFRFSSGSAHGEKDYSDSKAVTGAHPAVLGSDFHYYIEKSSTERGHHTEAVRWAYQQGYVITFDWHISGRGTTTYEYREESKNLVNNIVSNTNGDRDWLYEQFDKIIDIINNDLVVGGERIPIVFRPWHEMNGGWFWWGSKATNYTNYRELYKLTVDYLKERTTNVLFCWSPNTPTNMTYYPGDEYVDILGLDAYEVTANGLRTNLAPIIDKAQASGKVAVFAETGNRTSANGGDDAAKYWKNTVLPAIIDDPTGKSRKIAWVLTWINASWSFPYVPHAQSSSSAKQSFIDFRNSPYVLFGDEIPNLYLPMDPPVSVKGEARDEDDIEVFPTPSSGKVTIRLKNFTLPVTLSFYNVKGQKLSELSLLTDEVVLDSAQLFGSGVYLIKASGLRKTVSRRLVIE